MPRPRYVLIALGVLVVLALAALAASAALGRPAKTVTTTTVVNWSKPEVWETLSDFAAYEDWNPVITRAEGEPVDGSPLHLELVLPGHDPESLDGKVIIARPKRKIFWEMRLLLPGVRDYEYEFFLERLDEDRVLVTQQFRIEGPLAVFADADAAREALELQVKALAERLGQP